MINPVMTEDLKLTEDLNLGIVCRGGNHKNSQFYVKGNFRIRYKREYIFDRIGIRLFWSGK